MTFIQKIMMRLLFLLSSSLLWAQPSFSQQPALNTKCPPSFEKSTEGQCELRSLYDFYLSPPDHGGFRVNLPDLPHTYTPEQMDLGRYLFFDPALSGSGEMSCATCHQLKNSLADGRALSIASDANKTLTRSTPTLWNVAFLQRFMWDGRSEDLHEQAQLPLFSPDEMANTPENLVNTIATIPAYQTYFQQAYDDQATLENITHALAAFQTSLISLNSRYDRYVHGDQNALSEKEIRGYNTFRGFVGRCSQCHIPPLFTDGELAVVGAPDGQRDNGEVLPFDAGAGSLSDDPFLFGAFRVPTLRNITKTAPYFHSGQFSNLKQVMEFYNNTRGHMANKEHKLNIHWHIHMTSGGKLSKQDEDDVVAFLNALEDETLLPQVPKFTPSEQNQ